MKPGYCTNIHVGPTLAEIVANLHTFSGPIRRAVCPAEPMGIGLWLSRDAVSEALSGDGWRTLDEALRAEDLVPSTFNAFPWSDFHQAVVQHSVYLPTWADSRRLDFTLDVAELQCRLLDGRDSGSLSTLPLGWPDPRHDDSFLQTASKNIVRCARGLAELAQRFGRRIRLAIEPEPGCLLDTSRGFVDFYENRLCTTTDEATVRKYIGVCHDICHAAVMFEPQREALARYQAAGIGIPKIQVSSAVAARFDGGESSAARLAALAEFAEPRYLHQTSIRKTAGVPVFFPNLPPALAFLTAENPECVVRTHFHVPVHLNTIGLLETTRSEVLDALGWLRENPEIRRDADIEIETYAWQVAPQTARGGTLAESIVSELQWLNAALATSG